MTTVTFRPGARPSCRADSAVMAATISWPPSTVVTTSAMTAPSVTLVTVAGSWLRALILMSIDLLAVGVWSGLPRSIGHPPYARSGRQDGAPVGEPDREQDADGRHDE